MLLNDRVSFSDDDRRRIKLVRQEVVAAAGFRAETDADFGYRAAKILLDRPDDYDKEVTIRHAVVLTLQDVSLKYNHARKKRIEPTLRRARNALAKREALDAYPITGPGIKRQTVKDVIADLDEAAVRSAITHIAQDVRGQYEALSVYVWTLAMIRAIKTGKPEPTFKVLTRKELENDMVTFLLERYGAVA